MRPSLYQVFAILWHVNRGDMASALLVAHLPAVFFTEADALIEAAFLAGAVDRTKQG